jgi:hypothetical protein
MIRDWKPRQAPGKTSITEVARRHHAAAVALSQTLGLSLQETLTAHRESVTAVFIECGRCDLRVSTAVTLPPLAAEAPAPSTNGHRDRRPPQDMGDPGETPVGVANGHGRLPPEERLTQDQARALKALAQQAFGYAEANGASGMTSASRSTSG